MNPTLSQFVLGLAMAVVAILLVWRYVKYKRAGSYRRLQAMLEKVGVDPELAGSGDTESIMQEVRRRCSRCQSEDTCERWLAGDDAGDNDFCPNAKVLSALARGANPPSVG